MENENNKTVVDRIWDIFASVKLAIVIFIALSLTSIIGTIIEQNASPERNIKMLAKLFGQSAAPTLFRAFDALGFMDMYHSWWFLVILLLLSANLIICSIEKLPGIMKLVKDPLKPLQPESFKGLRIRKEFVLKGSPAKTKAVVSNAIKKIGRFNLSEISDGNSYQLYSQKGSYTRLGVYVVHFSIIVILIGAVAGIFFGYKGFLNLPEGTTSSVVYVKGGKAEKNLNFTIRCDDFDVEFYGNSDMPKKYRSWLTIIKDGKEVVKKMIAVNEPLKYEGVTFYQSSYGLTPEAGNSVFKFRVTSKDGKTEDVAMAFGSSFTVPGTNLSGKVEDFSPALGFDQQSNKPFTYAEQMNNPAVYLSFYENNTRKYGGWVLKRYPETWKLPEGHTIEFIDLWGIQYTGLQVRKDPGVWLVYLGCLAMTIGLIVAFFMSHRRIWVRLLEEKGNTRVIIGASANKNRYAFEKKIDKLEKLLTGGEEGGR